LSSQAQQLQQTMGFFRVDEGHQARRASRPKALPVGPSRTKTAARPQTLAPKAANKSVGIALDLSPDNDDDQFEKF
jgi:methyl-accepting chemotaxis protein